MTYLLWTINDEEPHGFASDNLYSNLMDLYFSNLLTFINLKN